MKSLNIFIIVSSSLLIQLTHANWGTPGSSSQYHIQTDEGPERFFRYQTDNGQFRKERRMQDGTVIGTNAWIDGFGYLRQNDYIADHAGYRILKSKTVFVGKDSNIEDAMKSSKTVPASSGILVPHSPSPPATAYIPAAVSTTTTLRPQTFTVTPKYYYAAKTPKVFIKHHAHPNDLSSNDIEHVTVSPIEHPTPSTLIFVPPHEDTPHHPPIVVSPSSTPRTNEADLPAIAYYPSSTTERPNIVKDESHLPPIAFYPSSNSLDSNNVIPLASTPSSISVNQLEIDGLQPPKEYGVVPILPKASRVAYRPSYKYPEYNRNDIPLFDRSKYYDGVSTTNNGFRYFLPRQYQEEQSHNDGTRDGSFGYIDPFGIRRVIYYNAGRNGFVHRKNNRYVGFNSTPYDPRPN